MKKYEILMDEENTIEYEGHILHRIKALKDFGDVEKGDLGGYVENKSNLSQYGNCWIYNDAKAMDNSRIYDDSIICGNSIMCDHSRIYDNSEMHGNSRMYNDSVMCGNSAMYGNSRMYDNSRMYNVSRMHDNSIMHDNSRMCGNSVMCDNSILHGNSEMHGDSKMYGDSELYNEAKLYGKLVSKVDDFVEIINPKGRLVTCVRKGDEILYSVGCQNEISEKVFKDRIKNEDGGIEKNPHREFYYKIIEASKTILLNK